MTHMEEAEDKPGVSLCTVRIGAEYFGIETSAVREALDGCVLRDVPLAPGFVAGVLAHRGNVLVAVNFRGLLGLAALPECSCAVVLQDNTSGELFALLVDGLMDVVHVDDAAWEPNPATLDAQRGFLFSGAYRTAGAPLVRLRPEHLQPSWLIQHLERAASGGLA